MAPKARFGNYNPLQQSLVDYEDEEPERKPRKVLPKKLRLSEDVPAATTRQTVANVSARLNTNAFVSTTMAQSIMIMYEFEARK